MSQMHKLKFAELSWLERAWLAAPIAIWFSYQPLMRLGQDSTSYYELSLSVIYVATLALVSLPTIWRAKKMLIGNQAVWLVGSFVLLSCLSLFWTPNLLRGVLTVGLIGLIFMVFLGALAARDKLKRLLPQITRLLVVSAVIVSLLAILQVVAGIWLGREETLLCAGCIADQFGFVRPNVFTIEPQFLGSLLLAPLLILLNKLLKVGYDKLTIASFLIVGIGLFLTLSRGAIFAFVLGAIVLFVMQRPKLKNIGQCIVLLVLAFLTSLLIQGSAAVLNPRFDTTFTGAVSAVVNQLTLGLVDIAVDAPQLPNGTEDEDDLPAFDGYVPESTNTRLSLSRLAVDTWASHPFSMLFGSGIGSAGVAMHEKFPSLVGSREIVQNEYAELLLEYGLLGTVLFAAMIAGIFYATRRTAWLWALILAYMFQWIFFSGYPNALHIYLVFIGLFAGAALANERRGAKALRE